MSILKSAFFALALAFGSVGLTAVTTAPAQAQTPTDAELQAEALSLIAARNAQLAAEQALLIAIINDPNASQLEKNVATGQLSFIGVRRAQLTFFGSFVPTLPSSFLIGFVVVLENEISANA